MKFDEYREQKTHGTSVFPLEYYFVNEEHPQYVMPLHWHREFEVLRVISGELILYLNSEVCHLIAGDVVFISPGVLHRGEPKNSVYECAVFDMKMAAGSNLSCISELIAPVLSAEMEIGCRCAKAEATARELLDVVSESEIFYELRASSLVSELLYHLYAAGAVTESYPEDKRIAHRRALMTLLIDKIEKEYTTHISLADLAEIAGMNEKYLCRFFKSFTGQTPIDYINRLRIDRACFEMSVNKMTVTEAAYECGFNELSYFSKIFKRYKGITPGQYRQRGIVGNGKQ